MNLRGGGIYGGIRGKLKEKVMKLFYNFKNKNLITSKPCAKNV